MDTIEVIADPVPLNRQLWENSPLNSSSVDEGAERNPEGFFGSKDPNFGILTEKPEHRLIILLKAQGHSNTEIARLTGYSIPWIGQVLRQPWAKERLLAEINAAGRDEVRELLRGAAVDSVFRIIQLRDEAEDDGVRLRASQDLLDRHLGKATQHVEQKTLQVNLTGDLEQVNAEIHRLEELEKQVLGRPTSGTNTEKSQ